MFPLLKPDWMPQSDIFRRLDHICMVVRDLETTVQMYESLGMRPWEAVSAPTYYTGLFAEGGTYSYLGHKFSSTVIGGVKLVLCQPVEDSSPQWLYLSGRGEGVFYFGFDVLDMDAAERFVCAFGLEVEYRCRMTDGRKFTKFKSSGAGAVFSFGFTSCCRFKASGWSWSDVLDKRP